MIVVNIEMPDNCLECPIRQIGLYKEYWCGGDSCKRYVDGYDGVTHKRPEWCPIIQELPDEWDIVR